MFDRILNRMREKIRMRQYIMTYHARREMHYDDLSIYDIERGILTGKILERQKDETTNEWKYHIKGKTVDGGKVEVIVKISPTDKLVIITLYTI